MKKLLTLLLLACATTLCAQLTPEQMGGTFYAYPTPATVDVAHVPSGYQLTYLSHYGRHGSRYMTSDVRYEWVLQHFADDSHLTREGRKTKRLLEKIYADARGNGGQLTALGARQHEGIARRMVARFPQLLQGSITVDAHASVVRRCQKSMEAFMRQLGQLLPDARTSLKADTAEMRFMAYDSPDLKLLQQEKVGTPAIDTRRLFARLFKDPSAIDRPEKLFDELYAIASDQQDVDAIDVSLYHLFTTDELRLCYETACRKMWHENGTGPESRGIPAQCAANLWGHIAGEADRALASGKPHATLRFGHDSALYRLLSLMGCELVTAHGGFNLHEIVPMGANLQMAFFVPADGRAGQTLVAFWLNEVPMRLSGVSSECTEAGTDYYSWAKVKAHLAHYLETQKWKDRTAAVNTMVGTDYAVTRTAGLYGKGSEEHGQTLPAVLAPHGMNFWTPQTRATEKKCIAPYYYPDSLLQGFRASHWIVGGCTQDYGSFTLMPLMGRLRLTAEERGSRFAHSDEVSHPYYYVVRLPDEHLTAELTASTGTDGTGSRAALFRFTPTESGTMHIVVQPNSDYREGFVAIDTLRNALYGYNPVHRIYQGWGERAGFSGYFVVQFEKPIVAAASRDSVAYVSFDVQPGEAILARAATSFTGLDGAWRNLQAEMPTWDFLSARLTLDSVWQQQLARIDVVDDRTDKVSEFYGALYRASFLPHVLSDADGRHPVFGGAATDHQQSTSLSSLPSPLSSKNTPSPLSSKPYYDDFSMWDIYRAQLPLLTIIDSTRMTAIAQSLVTKYEEGGWMPIFPCWNSYTAAMIGDHAAAALADAWVKGIRGFDVDKAYEGVRKNAFEMPATFEEYKNGMGRRALKSYLKYGYIPLEDNVSEAFHIQEQVSRTLEYAYDDFCAAQLAKATGHAADYQTLMKRSENWRNVFNPTTGWMDARHEPAEKALKKSKDAKGTFQGNTDLTSRVPFITEGAVVHYSFYVPHDVDGLMQAMGGKLQFTAKLDTLFGFTTSSLAENGRGGASFYWHGNEPCHHIAYLYALAGQPQKTQLLVRDILQTEYMDVPGGLSGNDDAGQMSAWYVFSALGFYPVCPGKAEYVLGAPSFRRVRIGRLTIEADAASLQSTAPLRISYNGQPYTSPIITHDMLTREGTLTFAR